jgi:ABC-type uncharacterized transport system permease subunit
LLAAAVEKVVLLVVVQAEVSQVVIQLVLVAHKQVVVQAAQQVNLVKAPINPATEAVEVEASTAEVLALEIMVVEAVLVISAVFQPLVIKEFLMYLLLLLVNSLEMEKPKLLLWN